jgi:hypothetical protein
MKTVDVQLGDRTYPIYIGNGLLDRRGELLRKHIPGKKVLIVTNETIAPLYLDKWVLLGFWTRQTVSTNSSLRRHMWLTWVLCRTIKALTADGKLTVETVILPDGEDHKSLDVVAKVSHMGKCIRSLNHSRGQLRDSSVCQASMVCQSCMVSSAETLSVSWVIASRHPGLPLHRVWRATAWAPGRGLDPCTPSLLPCCCSVPNTVPPDIPNVCFMISLGLG